jgi:glycine cleavage system H protein
MYPEEFRYTKEHEWVTVCGEIATIGITDYAQQQLGDIVYVDLPRVGDAVMAGKTMGSVESVKAVSDIYSPVTGEVVEANAALAEAPEKVNQDPHGEAWLVKVKLADPEEINRLLSAAEYQAYVEASQR